MIINIYQEALKRIPENDIDHHASDLYLRKTPETEKLIQEYKYKYNDNRHPNIRTI